jgi:hypothetical protein
MRKLSSFDLRLNAPRWQPLATTVCMNIFINKLANESNGLQLSATLRWRSFTMTDGSTPWTSHQTTRGSPRWTGRAPRPS